jgi:uncharacterized membrane protein YedE/YeeE
MTIVHFTPGPALAGGLLIGLAATLVLFLNGKIAGVSGIVARIVKPISGDTAWRATFLVGMIAGGAITFAVWPPSSTFELDAGWPRILLGAFLVGFGTRVGGGCTSGHGVCGISRGSRRSIAATLVFMLTGFATVYVLRHVLAIGAST